MDVKRADALLKVDPAEVGARLRAARTAAGMRQADVVEPEFSVTYLSRVESGKRRASVDLITLAAERLGVSLDYLIRGIEPDILAKLRSTLEFAELNLETGQAEQAIEQASEVIREAATLDDQEMTNRARFVHARGLEATGEYDDAAIALEDLLLHPEIDPLHELRCGLALCRLYRVAGDMNRAIETGEAALKKATDLGIDAGDETVQLTVTLAAAYYERGDVSHASRLCRRAVDRAKEISSPKAKAAAYWNSAMVYAGQGRHADAIPLAKEALRLLSDGRDTRNLARLKTELGHMQTLASPPDLAAAQEILDEAEKDLRWVSAAPYDLARNQLSRGYVAYLSGNMDEAFALASQVIDQEKDQNPLLAGNASMLCGRIKMAVGDIDGARAAYQQSVMYLTSGGADRHAATVWFDLGGLLEEVGLFEESRAAFRSAGAAVGLVPRESRPVGPLVG